MEADAKDMNIEQLNEKVNGLESQIQVLHALVPNAEGGILTQTSKDFFILELTRFS